MGAVLKKHFKAIFNTIFLIVLIAGTLYFVLCDQNITKIVETMTDVNQWWMVLAFVLAFVFVCGESVIMHYLMRLLKRAVRLIRCIKYSFIGFFFSYVTPSATGGQPMQMYYMQKDDIDVSVSALVLLLITVGYKMALLILSGIAFLCKADFILDRLGFVKYILIYGIAVNVIFIAFLCIVIFHESLAKSCIRSIAGFLYRIHIVKDRRHMQDKLLKMMEPYHEGAVYIRRHPLVIFNVLWMSVLQRAALFLVPWCVYRAYGLKGIGAFEIVALQTIISLAVDMLPLPGGVGAAEKSFEIMFESIFGAGLLIPGMLLTRGISYYFILLFSGVVTIVAHILVIRKRGTKEEC